MTGEADVRGLALALPETTEKPSYGRPGFRVKGRLFARIHEEGDLLVLGCDSLDEKEFLTGAELAELLEDSWRLRAPKRVVERLDAARAGRREE